MRPAPTPTCASRAWAAALSAALVFANVPAASAAPAWKATFEKDAAEYVGRWIQMRLLQRKFQRVADAGAYGDAEGARATHRPDPATVRGVVGEFVSGGVMLGTVMATSAVISVFNTREKIVSGEAFKYVFSVGAGVSIGATLIYAGSGASAASSGSPSSSGKQEVLDRYREVFAYSVTPSRVRESKATEIEVANAERQAKFVAELKKAALEISGRVGALLGMPESGRSRLEQAIEKRVLSGFRAQETWAGRTSIHIDVVALLNGVMSDAEARLALFDEALRAVTAEDRAPQTARETRIAYDAMISESAEFVRFVSETERVRGGETDPRIAAALRELLRFAGEQETLAARYRLHQRLIQ